MKKANEVLEIKPIELETISLRIVGDSPLIVHAWAKKAKQEMLDKQMGKAKTKKKEEKNPVEDFIEAAYWLTDKPEEYTEGAFEDAVAKGARWGFPVTAVKQATISSAYRNGLTKDKVSMQGAFFIKGEGEDQLFEIKGSVPDMREDMVKIGMGTADIRFRPQFSNWYADLELTYNKNGVYSLEQIVNLINIGGVCCGIGEWRTEKGGTYGMYHVATV